MSLSVSIEYADPRNMRLLYSVVLLSQHLHTQSHQHHPHALNSFTSLINCLYAFQAPIRMHTEK